MANRVSFIDYANNTAQNACNSEELLFSTKRNFYIQKYFKYLQTVKNVYKSFSKIHQLKFPQNRKKSINIPT